MRLLGARLHHDDPRFALLRQALFEADPLADAVASLLHDQPSARAALEAAIERGIDAVPDAPAPLRALFAAIDRPRPWLDRAALRLATDTMLRVGVTGTYALGGASLMSGYLSSGGVKPLAATGALVRNAERRLAETNKFVRDIATSGDVSRFSDGIKTTIRVRIMHAMVRRRLEASPAWRADAWGTPINQHDMVGTNLQFSVVYVSGLAALGYVLSRREREAVMHLWRYVGAVIGVREDLLPTTLAEGLELVWILLQTEEGPDDDSRALARALLGAFHRSRPTRARWMAGRFEGRFLAGYARFILGRTSADALHLPDDRWRHAPLVIVPARLALESLRSFVPGARERQLERGRQLIEQQALESLEGRPATFRADPTRE